MPDALEQLKERLAEVTDLGKIARLLSWDQQTMMPPAGSEARADHLATLSRLAHELFVDEETGRLLDELRPLADSECPEAVRRLPGPSLRRVAGRRDRARWTKHLRLQWRCGRRGRRRIWCRHEAGV